MRAGPLWLLAVVVPFAGGLVTDAVASRDHSDAWYAVAAVVWIVGPIVGFLAAWALAGRLHWSLRVLTSGVVALAWTVPTILLWMIGVAVGEGADL